MNKIKQERTLKKVKDGEYELRVNQPEAKLLQVKLYSKDELKELYNGMINEINQLRGAISQLKKKLINKPEWSDEELSVKVIVEKVLLNQQWDKDSQQLEYQESLLDVNLEHVKEIELVIPELKRK